MFYCLFFSDTAPTEFYTYGHTLSLHDALPIYHHDHMAGPFFLPADVKAGDFIEIGMLGAYGCAMRTKFNGFGADETHVVSDEPMASLYTGEVEPERRTATVTKLF